MSQPPTPSQAVEDLIIVNRNKRPCHPDGETPISKRRAHTRAVTLTTQRLSNLDAQLLREREHDLKDALQAADQNIDNIKNSLGEAEAYHKSVKNRLDELQALRKAKDAIHERDAVAKQMEESNAKTDDALGDVMEYGLGGVFGDMLRQNSQHNEQQQHVDDGLVVHHQAEEEEQEEEPKHEELTGSDASSAIYAANP